MKRIDFILVSSKFNLKPIIKLTAYIPINALFQDIGKFTTEKFREEKTNNNDIQFSERGSRLKCMLVNTNTFTSRFVKINDNIFHMSRKGNIIIFEIDDNEDDSDYYPYICIIKESIEVQENIEKIIEEDKNNSKSDVNDFKEKESITTNEKRTENNKGKKSNKHIGNAEVNEIQKTDKQNILTNSCKDDKQEKEKNILEKNLNINEFSIDQIKNLSFPRLFNLNLEKTIFNLRLNLYSFMRKFYKFDFSELKKQYPDIVKSNYTSSLSKLFKINSENFFNDFNNLKDLSESVYENYMEEEFKFIFEENYEEISQTNYIKNFPYKVKLISAKDDLKYKILFSNNPEEYNSEFPSEMGLDKINQYIKIGYKIVLEISKKNKFFNEIKNEMNKVISVQPKTCFNTSHINENYNGTDINNNNKNITLEDCLDNFTLTEKLEKGNEWYCLRCKKNQNSLKRMELYYVPKNLIIILKRFESKMIGKIKIQIWKNNTLVKYPINDLNLSKYFISNNFYKENNVFYDLYAISQHSGSLEGGHYASACRNFGKWYEIDDTTVFSSDEETIISPEGYILFYRRKEPKTN